MRVCRDHLVHTDLVPPFAGRRCPVGQRIGERPHLDVVRARGRGLDRERLGAVVSVRAVELGDVLATRVVGVQRDIDALLHHDALDDHRRAELDAIAM
jgi:hypothetical protein